MSGKRDLTASHYGAAPEQPLPAGSLPDRLLRQALDALPAHIAVTDAEGTIVTVNDAWRRFGRENGLEWDDDGIGRGYLQACENATGPCADEGIQLATGIRQVLAGGVSEFSLEYPCHSDTEYRWFLARVTQFADGGSSYLVISHENITARRKTEEERQAFIAAVSHDLKNPLTGIKGRTQVIRRRLARGRLDPTWLADGLQSIESLVDRTATLIDDLLDVAHLQAGDPLVLRLAPVDLTALARGAAAAFEAVSDRHRLRVESPAGPVIGPWDELRLRRVIDNLLANAIKYSPAGGTITLRVEVRAGEDGPWGTLAVSDEGVGIPGDEIDRVFERFRRGSNVGGLEGRGIGLYGARQIVTEHGGQLTVSSEIGAGSTFVMRLPMEARHPRLVQSARPSP